MKKILRWCSPVTCEICFDSCFQNTMNFYFQAFIKYELASLQLSSFDWKVLFLLDVIGYLYNYWLPFGFSLPSINYFVWPYYLICWDFSFPLEWSLWKYVVASQCWYIYISLIRIYWSWVTMLKCCYIIFPF